MKKLFSTIIFLLGVTTIGYSCICWNNDFPLKYLAQNDTLPINKRHYIIKGKVLNKIAGVYNKFGKGQAYNVMVLESWPSNSKVNDTVTVIDDELDCAVNFYNDSTYLIGAYTANRYLATSICEGTALLSQHQKHIAQLGNGFIPIAAMKSSKLNEANEIKEEKSEDDCLKLILASLLGLSLLTNIYQVIKQRKP